ncbi:hypothetical protein, partial [Schlesneria sp.]|uniref:hypothetical protein n=1 Tax=Schlesneria sp. TaxID=2762018 RepID=UPI002EE1D720
MNHDNEARAGLSTTSDTEVEMRPDLLLEQNPITKQILLKSDRIAAASFFGTMLLDQRLQSNCGRLEALVHLAVSYGGGDSIPTSTDFVRCFNELGEGVCGCMEDPAEDVFVSLVTTSEGNFRVVEGIWESGAFYAQRIVNVVETFPNTPAFQSIRRQVLSLLKLSDMVCGRAGLKRYDVGNPFPLQTIDNGFISDVSSETVIVSSEELSATGIGTNDLDSFILDDRLLSDLRCQPVENSPLQRFPILKERGRLALVLPTAVTHAIRAVVIDFLQFYGHQNELLRSVALDYSGLFGRLRLLGSLPKAPVHFSNRTDLPIAELMISPDFGCYLHFLFLVDTLTDFRETGCAGFDPTPGEHVEMIVTRIRAVVAEAKKLSHFRRGVTLLVHCGIGRGIMLLLPEIDEDNWAVHVISAPDLTTLSWIREFNALKLFKILDAEKRLIDYGIQIHNINGLLNLVAWVDSNDGHMVTHSQIPRDLRHSVGTIFVDSSFVLGVRASIARANDRHAIPTVDGQMEVVRRYSDSLLPSDDVGKIYTVETFSKDNGLPFTYLSANRAWWCHVAPSKDGHPDGYDRWVMLKTWLPRIIPVIEPRLDGSLSSQVLLRIEFDRCDLTHVAAVPTMSEIEQSFSVSVSVPDQTVNILVGKAFDRGLCDATNVSERQLALTICRGFALLAKVDLSMHDLSEFESQIVDSNDARHMHRFQARKFREYVTADAKDDVIRLDEHDVAALRMGIAFRVESREKGR